MVRPDYTIIDGYHRWLLSGQEPLLSRLRGRVPIVVVEHADHTADIYGTITHNRARGVHLLGPMEKIVQELLAEGKPVEEIAKQIGMKREEVYRLSGLDREGFLKLMVKNEQYGHAFVTRSV